MPAAPFYIVLNAASGHSDTDTTRCPIADVLNAAGQAPEILRVENPEGLGEAASQAVTRAKQNSGVVIAAGGGRHIESCRASHTGQRLPVRGDPARHKVATDGEVDWVSTPIEFRVAPEPLLLLTPIDAVPETAG